MEDHWSLTELVQYSLSLNMVILFKVVSKWEMQKKKETIFLHSLFISVSTGETEYLCGGTLSWFMDN